MRAIGRHSTGIALSAILITTAAAAATPLPALTDEHTALDRPHVLDGDAAGILVRVHGSSACSGTPIADLPLVITAAHCVLDQAGEVTRVTVARDGVKHTPEAVLVDTRYHEHPIPRLDAAVLVMDRAIPGPAATLGHTLPTQGLVTLAGFQPIDTDGTLLRGTRYGERPLPKGVTGGVIEIESLPTGCVDHASALEIADDRITVGCGLIPGASGGGLFAEHGGRLVLLGIISTVGRDLSYNELAPLAAVRELLDHPDRYEHELPGGRPFAARPALAIR